VIKPSYSTSFEAFWAELNKIKSDPLGAKGAAYKACKKLKVLDDDYNYLHNQYRIQVSDKRELESRGIWVKQMQHVSTWLNSGGYEDERDERVNQRALSRSDQRKQDAVSRYLQSDLGEGMANADSSEAPMGRGRLQHL
jgi:hypothetical protein